MMAKRAVKAKAKTKKKKTGRKVGDPVPVSIKKAEENWSVYKLSDGTTLRSRPVMVDVVRKHNTFDDKGNPVYTVTGGMIYNLKTPNKLKRKKK